jgi:hypothetical protein
MRNSERNFRADAGVRILALACRETATIGV